MIMGENMKIIYMGTPDFAVPPLEMLVKNNYSVELVITQPDKARDRGKKVQFTPVKQKALELGIQVLQPEKVKGNDELIERIKALDPDLIIVAAYGKILPLELLEVPKLGCINIHASLLPKYRGAAPIHRSIIEGESITGVTLMYMEEGLDTGDMIASRSTKIGKKTAAELHDELSIMGAELLIDTMPDIINGSLIRTSQDDSMATYAPMIFKKDGLVDFEKTPIEIERLIQGLNSWPGAYTLYRGEQMKLWKAEALDEKTIEPAGTIIDATKQGIKVAAGGSAILIKRIQMPGKKAMDVAEYLKGNNISIGVVLGS